MMDDSAGWRIGAILSRDAVMGMVFAVAEIHRGSEFAYSYLVDGVLQGVYDTEQEAQTMMEMAAAEYRMEQLTGRDCML